MGLFDQQAAAPEAPKHKFLSGDLSGFVSEMAADKQDMGIDESAGLDDLEKPELEEREADYQEIKTTKRVANVAGSSLALMADALIPVLLALLFRDDADNYRCDPTEKDMLEKAFADYAQLQGVEMPPWLVLVGTVLSIYGFKAYHGFKIKNEEKENAKIVEENKFYGNENSKTQTEQNN